MSCSDWCQPPLMWFTYFQGDVWAESHMLGFYWHYYACMEGKIFDITEWAKCKVRLWCWQYIFFYNINLACLFSMKFLVKGCDIFVRFQTPPVYLQRENFKSLQANSHQVIYRLTTTGRSRNQPRSGTGWVRGVRRSPTTCAVIMCSWTYHDVQIGNLWCTLVLHVTVYSVEVIAVCCFWFCIREECQLPAFDNFYLFLQRSGLGGLSNQPLSQRVTHVSGRWRRRCWPDWSPSQHRRRQQQKEPQEKEEKLNGYSPALCF